MPHSTQIRTRWGGWLLREKSFFRMDMMAPVNDSNLRRIYPQEGLLIREYLSILDGEGSCEGYNFAGFTRRTRSAFCDGAMPTKITERRIGDVTILQVSGHVILGDGAPELRARMNDLIDEAHLRFLLDLRGVTYIDSFGVGVIAAKYVSVRRKGGDVKLLRLSPRSHRVMRISGLLKIFETFDSEEDALNSFAPSNHSNQAAG